MTITPVSPNPFSSSNNASSSSGGTSNVSSSDSIEAFINPSHVAIPSGTLSYSFLLKMMSGASLGLSAQIRNSLQLDAEQVLEFFTVLAQSSAQLLTQFNTSQAQFQSETMDENQTGPAIVNLNSLNATMQADIAAQATEQNKLASARVTYQAAVDAYNNSPNSTPQERNSALADYNQARVTYEAAITAYNQSVQATNKAITDYRKAVTDYETLVNTVVNPDIAAANKTRTTSPPIPDQTVPSDQVNWNYINGPEAADLSPVTFSNPPPQNQPDPNPVPTIPAPPPYAVDIVDPRTITFTAAMQDFVTASEQFFNLNALTIQLMEDKQDRILTGRDLLQKIRLNPETTTNEYVPVSQVSGESPGGLAMAALTLRLRQPASSAILNENLAKQQFIQENIALPNDFYSTLLTMTLKIALQTGQLASYPGVSYLKGYIASLPPNSPAVGIAASLGYNTTLANLLNNQGLFLSIQNILGQIPSLSNLTAEQQQSLAQGLSAQVSDSLLRIGVNTLASQLGTPSVGDTLRIAALLANPNNSGNVATYQKVSGNLTSLTNEFGANTVALPLSQFLQGKLIDGGLSPAQAGATAQQIAIFSTTQGLGRNPTNLQNFLSGIGLSGQQQTSAFESVITFSAAASLKQDVQASLISGSGPAQALNLSDHIVKNLYGFSVDLTQSGVQAQNTADQQSTSIVQLAVDNRHKLLKAAKQEALDAASEAYGQSQIQDTSLDAFQRMVIDPGVKLFGLMYDGAHGTSFERKSVDIKIA